jgi:hypothetical protein
MWDSAQPFFVEHKKAVGIFGDSITFLGSVLLSLEALLKKTERIKVAGKRKLLKNTHFLGTRSGETVTDEQIENRWVNIWSAVSKWGIVILTLGFLALLLGRIFTE